MVAKGWTCHQANCHALKPAHLNTGEKISTVNFTCVQTLDRANVFSKVYLWNGISTEHFQFLLVSIWTCLVLEIFIAVVGRPGTIHAQHSVQIHVHAQ